MNPDDKILARIRAVLADVPDVKEKRMFGGTAFMVRGKMCVTGRAERIMCRIDPDIYDSVLARGDCREVVMKGRVYRGYVYVDVESVTTNKVLGYWVGLALEYNEALTAG